MERQDGGRLTGAEASEKKALELWHHFFDEHDAPWETNDYGQTYCFFCAADHPGHHSNCIYVAAAELLGRELTVKVGY